MSPEKTTPPKPKPPTIKDFEKWVEGRTGLTQTEFFDAWVGGYDLTPEEIEDLRNQLKILVPKPPAPKPARPAAPTPPIKKEEPKPPTPKPAAPPTPALPKQPTVKPKLIIERTPFPKWWKELGRTGINLSGLGAQIIVPWLRGKNKYLMSLNFTVDGETDIYLRVGYVNITGPMSFGGDNEPRGMAMNFSDAPVPCGPQDMSIYSVPKTGSVQVSGIAVYYVEP